MAKDPAFLFYSSDFLAGVSDLTMEERGQYITLLCLQHQKSGRLSRKAVAIAVPNAATDVMAKFKVDENGLLYNERLEKESLKRKNHSDKQRQRALDGWKKRKSESIATADATALPLEDENVNEDIIKKKGDKKKKYDFRKSILELGVQENIYNDWAKVRKAKSAVNTETAFKAIKTQIDKSKLTPNECIKISAEKSWAGFNPDWLDNSFTDQSKTTSTVPNVPYNGMK